MTPFHSSWTLLVLINLPFMLLVAAGVLAIRRRMGVDAAAVAQAAGSVEVIIRQRIHEAV